MFQIQDNHGPQPHDETETYFQRGRHFPTSSRTWYPPPNALVLETRVVVHTETQLDINLGSFNPSSLSGRMT